MLSIDTKARVQTVMVVDNDFDLRSIVSTILDSEGLSVLTAADGQEALSLLEDGEIPDLILSDLSMPGMGGSEFFARLKADSKTRNVPVIISSGSDDIETKTRDLGATVFLKKPYHLEALTNLIKAQLLLH